MTLKDIEAIRATIQAQYDAHMRNPAAPGQEATKCLNAIELLAALRTVDQFIVHERASLVKPPGSLGPVLVGV